MLLLVGLGNPGSEYAKNRHNIGFMAIDAIAELYSFAPFRKKFHGALSEGVIDGVKVLALKPETFMNDSGRSVAGACAFYKISPQDIIVVHDEIDLAAKILRLGEVFCRPQQHGAVAVVATGMHDTMVGGAMIKGIPLDNRQGIHIRTQTHRRGLITHLQNTDDTGLANAPMHLDTEFLQLRGDKFRRAVFLKPQFRMGMEIFTPVLDFVFHGNDIVNKRHLYNLNFLCRRPTVYMEITGLNREEPRSTLDVHGMNAVMFVT